MRVLITGGGCREYIDSVRVVTNSSTGKTSAALADFISENGNLVKLITAENAERPKNSKVEIILFQTGQELARAIEKELCSKSYDLVIHAAAVSDYIPYEIEIGKEVFKAGKTAAKLPSGKEMKVSFKPSPKIADKLGEWADRGGNPLAQIFCFKLTSGASEEERKAAVKKLFLHSSSSFIISNDLSEIGADQHPFRIIKKDGEACASGKTNLEMAQAILKLANGGQ